MLAGWLGYFPTLAQAQSGGSTAITSPDTTQFPAISFFLEVYDSTGNFANGLQPEDLRVLENGQPRPVSQVTPVQPGMQISIAWNLAPFLANRTGSSSLYQNLQSALLAWSQAYPEGSLDDLTLLSNDGVQAIHETDTARFTEKITGFQPDLLHSKSSLGSLTQALDIASDPNPRPNMKRALLYITSSPADATLASLPNLARRAAQMGVHITVWLVAPQAYDATKGADALRELADRSGGQFFLYSGAETLPNIEAYFKPLRSLYQVSYTSAITKAGQQSLAAEVSLQGRKVLSSTQPFSLNVQPPNPIFLSPPSQVRRAAADLQPDASAAASQPEETYPLKIMVEFPDGFERPLKSLRLFVDGRLAAERTSPPFDQLDWDLSGYQASEKHMLQVKVEDNLGLSQASIEMPVEVLVDQPEKSWLREQVSAKRLVLGGSILLAGVALGMVLWISGRRGWLKPGDRRKQRRILKDPLTQPVHIRQEQPLKRTPASAEHPSWPRTAMPTKAPAWLIRLDENNQPIAGHTVPIVRREVTFGSDPQHASCVINAPSVDGLHARLYLSGESYILADAGSTAGTWVNYSPVSPTGTSLEHGDLVNFGQVTFRFELANPPPIRQPQVTDLDKPL